MSDFPQQIAQTMLSRFGMDQAKHLQPWPFPDLSTDLLARFEHDEKCYFLKRRCIEQRGKRSLFETQFIQKELLKLGIPVPALWQAPNGETLLTGPDWEGDCQAYYEIQEMLPGKSFVLDKSNAFQAGQFLGRFHQAGAQIDTYLLNKGYWIKDFTSRRHKSVHRQKEQLHQCPFLSPTDTRLMEDMIDRTHNFLHISARTWGVYHGDLCSNNLLTTGTELFLIDFEEIGIGEIWGDISSLISEVPNIQIQIITPLLKGYRDGGGTLNTDDHLAIIDMLALNQINRAIQESDKAFDVSQLLESFQFIKDL